MEKNTDKSKKNIQLKTLKYKNFIKNSYCKSKKVLKILFRKRIFLIFISIYLLFVLLKDVEFSEIIHAIKSADLTLLLMAFSLHALGLTISAIRWKILLKSFKINSKTLYLVKSYLVATFFNHFIPSTIGGDSFRAYDTYKIGKDKTKGFVVVLVDRFLGLIALLVFVIISTFFSIEVSSKIPNLAIWIVFFSFAVSLTLWFMLKPPISFLTKVHNYPNKIISKIGRIFLKIGNAFGQFSKNKKVLLKALALSFLLQANVVLYYYLISIALGFGIHIINFSLIIPLTIFIMMVPLSVNGIGIRENVLFFFFSFFGIAKTQAIAFAWIEFGMLLILGVIGGIVYMIRRSSPAIESEI